MASSPNTPERPRKRGKANDAVTLRLIQITDVYQLENFPHFKTLFESKKQEALATRGVANTYSMLTGDFLAPFLLSSLDKGTSMMRCINSAGIDFLTWGNHEHDLSHNFVCQRVKEFNGTWINTNMQSHEMMPHQVPFKILEVKNAAGTHSRKVGLVAVLSDDPTLYRKNAFNGASIEDPWETLRVYKRMLEEEHGVDLVIPLCHLYVNQDHRTCREFDFPLIFSGHDHHFVDEVYEGTRLLKAGMDATHAIVCDITWDCPRAAGNEVELDVEKCTVAEYAADAALADQVRRSCAILDHLQHTQLCDIPDHFRPLSSRGSREHRTTMSSFLCGRIRDALNADGVDKTDVDCVIIPGGCMRGSVDIPASVGYFSLKDLKSEFDQAEVSVQEVPGGVIADGIEASYALAPSAYLCQYDNSIQRDAAGRVTHIANAPVDRDRMYRVGGVFNELATVPGPFHDYCAAYPERLPPYGSAVPVDALLLSYFAGKVWNRIFAELDRDGDGVLTEQEISAIDTNGDGRVSKEELKAFLTHQLGYEADEEEDTFVDWIMETASRSAASPANFFDTSEADDPRPSEFFGASCPH